MRSLLQLLAVVYLTVAPDLHGAPQQNAANPADATKPPDAAKLEVTTNVSGILAPGSSFSIGITGDKSHKITPHSLLDKTKPIQPLEGTNTGGDSFRFTLPAAGLDPGPYYFTLVDDNTKVVPGSIDVEANKITILSVHPATVFRDGTNAFNFVITGENFSPDVLNDNVLIEDQEIIEEGHTGKNAADCESKPKPCLWVDKDGRSMYVVGYNPDKDKNQPHQGIVNVGVKVGNVAPADRQQLVLARRSGTAVIILSVALTALLFWIVSLVVKTGLANNKVGGRALNLYQSFIFDPETNSYSLSKFQLLMFSGTFIFGYIYVLLSRWLVQWQFVLPDVPQTIAGLLGISGGTTVASAGLTAARGAKGAGLQHPTGADLISTGGVVVPERFQFFVWTIVSCGGFIALLVGQESTKVSNFPDLPQGLLYVMGVSAAGYLGGKAARKPGPSLENIGVQRANDSTPWQVLLVQGQNLASDGRFFIDEQELKFPSDEDKTKLPNLPPTLVTGVPQAGASDTNFCTRLDIVIANSSLDLSKGDHTFRIVNRDGQFADGVFSGNSPTIAAVYDKGSPPPGDNPTRKQIMASDKQVPVVIAGGGLITGSTVGWRAPGQTNFATQTPIPGAAVDGTELWVSLVPGTTVGHGAINVTTPRGFVVGAAVNVVGPDSPPSTDAVTAGVSQQPVPPPNPATPGGPQQQVGTAGPAVAAPVPAAGPVDDTATSSPTPAEGQHPDGD